MSLISLAEWFNNFDVYPHSSMYQQFISLYYRVVFCPMKIPQFIFSHLSIWIVLLWGYNGQRYKKPSSLSVCVYTYCHISWANICESNC